MLCCHDFCTANDLHVRENHHPAQFMSSQPTDRGCPCEPCEIEISASGLDVHAVPVRHSLDTRIDTVYKIQNRASHIIMRRLAMYTMYHARRFTHPSTLCHHRSTASCRGARQLSGGTTHATTLLERIRDILNPFGNTIVTCGSIGLVTAYAMEDVLHLRLSAIFGTGSFVLFYLVQKPILVTPAAWGCLNLSINAYMTARILLERRPVSFTEEELDVYEEHFRPFGCSARSFRLFWDAGRRRTYRAGEVIQPEGQPLTSLSLVIDGRVERLARGKPIPALFSYPGARNANPDGCDAGAWIGELGLVQNLNGSQRRLARDTTRAAADGAPEPRPDGDPGGVAPQTAVHGPAEQSGLHHDQQQPPATQPGTPPATQPGAQPTAQALYALPAPPDSVVALQQRLGELQQRLRALGFYDGSVDATAGPKTELAIKAFQHAAGLKVHAGAALFSVLLVQVE